MIRIFSFLLLVGLGYCPSAFVLTNAMLVLLNINRYDYKISDKNNTAFAVGVFVLLDFNFLFCNYSAAKYRITVI